MPSSRPKTQIPDPGETGTVPDDISGAVSTALNILERWQVSPAEQQVILGISRRTWFNWRTRPPAQVDTDKLERISYVLGIWKALRQLFPSEQGWERWPWLPNSAGLFAGRKPIELMAGGQVADLYRVRAWLDGWRGWN